jgi:small GTP-binding protein
MASEKSDMQIVVIGDHNVGKSTLIHSYFTHNFSDAQIPSIRERYTFQDHSTETPKQVEIIDTLGMKVFEHDRQRAYAQADVIVLCFSVANPDSFKNVSKVWWKEIKRYARKVPVILVGNKADKYEVEDSQERECLIMPDRAKRLKGSLDFYKYISCSARKNYNIHKVFQVALEACYSKGSKSTKPKRKFCCMGISC